MLPFLGDNATHNRAQSRESPPQTSSGLLRRMGAEGEAGQVGGWGCGLWGTGAVFLACSVGGWRAGSGGPGASGAPQCGPEGQKQSPQRAGSKPRAGRGGCQHSGQLLRGLGEGVMSLGGVKAPELQPLEGWGWPGLPSHATGGGTGSGRAMQGLLAPSHAEVASGTQP